MSLGESLTVGEQRYLHEDGIGIVGRSLVVTRIENRHEADAVT